MTDELWGLEESWWTMGAAEARRRMHPSCIMSFVHGILQGEEVLAAVDAAARWDSVQIGDRHKVETEDCVVLGYRADAVGKRGDYSAVCSSTWVRQEEGWQLIQHQQTPLE